MPLATFNTSWLNYLLAPWHCSAPRVCREARQIQQKAKGGTAEATTMGDNHKQAMKGASAQNDKDLETLKTEAGISEADIEKSRYVRDSEVSWLNDQWLYDRVYPLLHQANDQAGWKYEFSCSESFQFTKYGL